MMNLMIMNKEEHLKYIEDLEQVRKRISEIRDEYDSGEIIDDNGDVRYSFLNQFYRLITSYIFGLVDFVRSTYGENKVKELFKVEDNFETAEILLDYFNFLKLGFIYSTSSLTENYLRTVFRHLFPEDDSHKEFYHIRKKVFKKLSIGLDSNYWYALSLLSNIRNCIHNNGIHISKREDIKITYHGDEYLFINNEPQNSSAPSTILLIINDILSLTYLINTEIDFSKDLSLRRTHDYSNK